MICTPDAQVLVIDNSLRDKASDDGSSLSGGRQ